jgi:hypothetical protein
MRDAGRSSAGTTVKAAKGTIIHGHPGMPSTTAIKS